MAFFKVFSLPKNQQFNYKPLHWDQKKEEMQDRMKEIESLGDQDGDVEMVKKRIANRFQSRSGGYIADTQFKTRQINRANYRFILILIALIISSFLLVSSQFENWIKMLE